MRYVCLMFVHKRVRIYSIGIRFWVLSFDFRCKDTTHFAYMQIGCTIFGVRGTYLECDTNYKNALDYAHKN